MLTAKCGSLLTRSTMRAALSIALLFCAAGCKHQGSQKLEGHWKGQRADGVPETSVQAANVFAQGSDIYAQRDQITINTPGGRNAWAVYTIDKEDATTLVLHTDRDPGAETFMFNDTNTLVWKVDAQRSITFKRVR